MLTKNIGLKCHQIQVTKIQIKHTHKHTQKMLCAFKMRKIHDNLLIIQAIYSQLFDNKNQNSNIKRSALCCRQRSLGPSSNSVCIHLSFCLKLDFTASFVLRFQSNRFFIYRCFFIYFFFTKQQSALLIPKTVILLLEKLFSFTFWELTV